MEEAIKRLTQMQIDGFFKRHEPTTQRQVDEEAARIAAGLIIPTLLQGGSSYTVQARNDNNETTIVQFRHAQRPLPMELMQVVEQSYKGYVPHHREVGTFRGLPVYTMSDVGGVSMYLARTQLHQNDCFLLRTTLQDYARFFASAWHNAPHLQKEFRVSVRVKHAQKLRQLQSGLPIRFRPILDRLIDQLELVFAEDWPIVPNHVDLLENNIHVDVKTGHVKGICDWGDAELGPFGLSLGAVEGMLGIARKPTLFEYHANHNELRGLFWQTLCAAMGDLTPEQKHRVQIAKDIGLFLNHGFTLDDDGNLVPAPDGEAELPWLETIFTPPGNKSAGLV